MKPLPWIGSKTTNVGFIIDQIPDHDIYVEAFFGGGSILFNKPRSRSEVINDNNDLLVNFFDVVKNDVEGFLKKFEWTLYSRTIFDRYKKTRLNEIADPVEKAFVFYYLVRNSWCHLFRLNADGYFNAPFSTCINASVGVRNLSAQFFDSVKVIKQAHDRLAGVGIECLDYKEAIEKYDTERTFFFLDPPYDTDYQYSSKKPFDHAEMKKIIDNTKGKWLLTLDASKEDMFKDHEIQEIKYRDLAERDKHVTNILVKSRNFGNGMKTKRGDMY